MNKQYKVIWSKVKNTYVVVSELAKSYGKSESGSSSRSVSAAAVLAAVAVLTVPGVALAAQDGVTTFVDTTNKNIRMGNDTKLDSPNGSIAIGDHAHVNNYASQAGGIAFGTNAYVENMAGNQERTFTFGQTDQTQWAAGIAIGQNTYARSGSIMIGDHKYVGALGDVTVDGSNNAGVRAKSLYINSTTLGANAYNSGSFSTVNGSYSIATSDYQGLGGFAGIFDGPKAAKNFGANIYGSLNSIESASSSSNYSGVASSVIGTANRTANSNGALIFGAGNEITNSITAISAPSSGGASAKELQTTLMTSIKNSQSGGATLAIGGGNKADYTQKTSIIGVNNTVTGTSSNISQYNSVTGFNNTATNVDNTIVVGTNRTVSDLEKTVVIGTADSATATTASNAVAIGNNANVTVDGGVALGSNSVASVAAGVTGYDPNTKAASTTDSATWKSTLAAVSVGIPTADGAATATRQITGVAAGMQDTDAVNVAQLKASKVNLTEGDNVTITSKTEDDGSTTYTIKSTDTNTTLASGTVSYTDGDGTLVLTDSAGNNVTVSGLKNTYVTSAALNGNTLTLTRNDGGTVTVDGIASSTDITNLTNTINANKTHFYSVNFTDEKAGNYNNNGATGTNALAAGVAASAQTNNSVAVGTNARVLGNGGNRDTGTGSIAIGENALVTTNGLNLTSIAMGKGATVLNGSGKQDKALSFTPDNYASGSDLPIDPDKSPGGIAIGANAYARTGSVQIGSHTMKGYTMGGSEINDQSQANLVGMTTIGTNSYNKGAMGSMLGAYSVMTGDFTGAGGFNSLFYGSQNFGANVVGSLNSIRSAGYSGNSGIANSIVGIANIAENANGALIYGAGNKITNAVQSISGVDTLTSNLTVDDMVDTLRTGIQRSNGGGSTMAIGGGNTADYTQNTAIIGVNNTVTGVRGNTARYNSVTGYGNTATNVDNVTVTGINNTVADTTTAVVIGDRRSLTGANKTVVLGSADATMATTAKNAVILGNNANATVDDGVALGSGSVASVAAEVAGYDVTTKAASADTSATWKSTLAAVSVGVPTDGGAATATRQITGVAAGMQDTDAVNVAQLKQVAAAAEDAGKTTLNFTGDDTTATIARGNGQTLNITGGATEFTTEDNIGVVKDGDNALKVKLAKDLTMADGSIAFNNNVKLSSAGLSNGGQKITNVAAGEADTDAVNVSQLKGSTIKSGTATYANNGTGSMTLTMENGDTVTVNGLQDKYINGASLANNTLTITRNDGTNFTVDNIATMDDISNQVGNVALNFAGDDATAKVTTKNNGTLNITGGAASNNLTDDNIGVVKSADDTLQVKLSKDLNGLNSVRVGGSKAGEGIYIAKQSVNNSKGVAEEGNYITGLTNTTWNPTANGYVTGRAATEDQLNSVYETINQNIESSKAVSGKNITVGEDNKVNLNDNITLGGDTADKQVNINGDAATVTAGGGANKVVVDGTNGQVTIGDAANGGIVMGNQSNVVGTKADGTKDSQNGQYLTGLDNTKWDPANQGIVENRAATEGQLKGAVDSISKQISDIDTAVKSSSRVFESDSGEANQVTRKNTDAMKLKGGADANNLSDNNIGVVNNSDGTGFDIKLSKDIKGLNSIEVANNITIGSGDNQTIINDKSVNTGSVTTGNTTINNSGLTIKNEDGSNGITIQNNNVSMGGNVIQNVGDGVNDYDAINKGQFDRAISNLDNGMGHMNNRINKLDDRVNRVGAGAGVAVGTSSEATTYMAAAIGNSAKATGSASTAIGYNTTASGNNTVALGSSAAASNTSAISIGNRSKASGSSSVAIGPSAAASSRYSTALGASASATADYSLASGYQANASGNYGVASGYQAQATDYYTTAVGYQSKATKSSASAFGNGATASGTYSLALGYNSAAAGNSAIAIGNAANVASTAANSVAIGKSASAASGNSVALGQNSLADTTDVETTGYLTNEAFSASNGVVSVGNASYTDASGKTVAENRRRITNVAAGADEYDAVNVAQLKALESNVNADISDVNSNISTINSNISTLNSSLSTLSATVDANKISYVSVNSTLAGNKNNDGATGTNAVAIGGASKAAGNLATALGTNTTASAERAVALGNQASATGMSAIAIGNRSSSSGATSIAIGSTSTAASGGIALGISSKATASSSMALGQNTSATEYLSMALGNFATASASNATAMGYLAKAKAASSTAIGNRAETNGIYSLAFGDRAYVGGVNSGDGSGVDVSVPNERKNTVSEERLINPLESDKYSFSMAMGTDAKAYGYQNTAIGGGAEAYDTNTLAVGFTARAKGHLSSAIGSQASTSGKYATALGFLSNASAESASALGDQTTANIAGGVALGSKSKTNVASGVIGYDPSGTITSQADILGSNQATYTQLQSDIATAQSKVDSLSSEIVALQTAKNTAKGDDLTSINSQITAKETEIATARAELASLQTQSNALVSTWQSTGAAVSVGNSETGLTRQITNVVAGTLDTDAVNVAQLKALSTQITQNIENVTLDNGKNITIGEDNSINLNDKITLNNENDAINQVTVDGTTSTISAGTDANEVTINGGNATITAGTGANQVTIDGANGQVVIGDAANGGIVMGNQEVTTTNGTTEKGQYITGLDNTTWDPNNYVADRAATEGQLAKIAGNISDINTSIDTINNAKRGFVSDSGEKIELGKDDVLNLKGGADTSSLTEGNIGVVNNDAGNGFDIKLSSKLSGLDSVDTKTLTASEKITVGSGSSVTSITGDTVTTSSLVAGNTTVNNSGLTIAATDSSKSNITISNDSISMGGNQVHNVAAGTADTDAVNVSQLNSAVTNIGGNMNVLNGRINDLDNRVDRVGAGAAALAALHPLDYDPTSRWEVAAGVGNYKGANAVAVGAFYRPNGDTMFSIGSSYGGGENMVNAGVTMRIGSGQTTNLSSRAEMAREITDLKSTVEKQKNEINELSGLKSVVSEQQERIEQLTQIVNQMVASK